MSHNYSVKVNSVKHDIRNWTITILQENLRIIHDNDYDVEKKLNQIKDNIEMIIHYLTLCKKNTDTESNKVVVNKTLDIMNLESKDLLETSTIWE